MNIHDQLTQPYVISPIDNNTYCRANGHFLRHLKKYGYESYQHFFETLYPELIQYCKHCGTKCSFNKTLMKYKQTCGSRICCGRVTSGIRAERTSEEWDAWRVKHRLALSKKTPEMRAAEIQSRRLSAIEKNSYKLSVRKRERTCLERHGDTKYNNTKKASQSKLQWTIERKQQFLDRVRLALGGKWMSDFTTEQTWIDRTERLVAQGRISHPSTRSARVQYYKKVSRLTERNYRQHKHLINPNSYNRALAGTVNGYQLDHKIPVIYGFLNNIAAHIIADITNLQMLPWRENGSKGYKYESTS